MATKKEISNFNTITNTNTLLSIDISKYFCEFQHLLKKACTMNINI